MRLFRKPAEPGAGLIELADKGAKGDKGERGAKGRSLTLWQALSIFLVVVAVSVTLSVRTELQQRKIEQQQVEIAANTAKILEARYQGCLGGIAILNKFNKQMQTLADIERTQTVNPRLAKARIKAYEEGETVPLPECQR